MKIQILKDDLSRIISEFDDSERITSAQDRVYPKRREGKRITPDMLGYDHPETLCLLNEDGWDGKPVGSLSISSIRHFWDMGSNQYVPVPVRDLVRFGVFMHLEFYHTLALALKAEWEPFLAHRMDWQPGTGKSLRSILLDEKVAQVNKDYFNPDTTAIFQLFEGHGQQASAAGYSLKGFDTLVQEMILNDMHLRSNNAPELEAFIRRVATQQKLLKEATDQQHQEFWVAKSTWFELQEELGEQLLLLENCRLHNAHIFQKWMAVFGNAYIELKEHIYRLKNLELQVFLKEANPGLSREALEKKVAKKNAEWQKELERQKLEAAHAASNVALADIHLRPIGGIDEKKIVEHNRKCKQTLLKLRFLLHPDKLMLNPAYDNLTDKQKQYLEDLGRKILEVKLGELTGPFIFGSSHRSLTRFQEALDEAKTILANAGLDINPRLVIQGETIEEQLEWLKQSIERLEEEIESVKGELRVLMEDPDIREKSDMLVHPEEHERLKAEMMERAKQYRDEGKKLEEQLVSLFGEETES